MKSSSMQLNEFFITRMNLQWIDMDSADDREDCPHKLDIDYEVAKHKEHENLFRLVLRVALRVKDDHSGLNIDSEIAGFFSFPPEAEEEEMQYLVRINGATILYGILRGQIAMTSGSFPAGKFLLPAVVMQDILPAIDRDKDKERNDEMAEDSTDYGN